MSLKSINILSLVQAFNSLDEKVYANYLKHYDIDIKREEVVDLKSLVAKLEGKTSNNKIFNGYFVGYKIPQIGKEFDLLRFGKERVINLELKSESTHEKIEKQLKRNKYYLSYLETPQHNLAYVSSTEKLYMLNNDNNLEEVDFSYLEDLLSNQMVSRFDNADELFNPSDYLVSPFNSTGKFLSDNYFLTSQQENIKSQIAQSFISASKYTFISIAGSAGTGKTLLTYDIVKELKINKKKPLIIHCGYLNEGQKVLNANGWEIIPIKSVKYYDLSNYDAVIIDEAQRIYPNQLKDIVEKISSINGFCIFSYDKLQTLSSTEKRNDIDAKIDSIDNIVKYNLSEKIRTNKEIALFMKSLFNNKRNFLNINKGNIVLNYFERIESAKEYVDSLDGSEWEVIRFTPSQYNKEHHEEYSDHEKKSSHGVIGQEFDGVAVIIDKYFSYDKNGDLIYREKVYYDPVKMLFQNITRTRKKLNLVIIGNENILDRCVFILN